MSMNIIICSNCEYVELKLFDDNEYEPCPNCRSQLEVQIMYTQSELQAAIKKERQDCIKACEGYYTGADCIEALRARG